MARNRSEKELQLPRPFPPEAAPHQDFPLHFHERAYWDMMDFYAAELPIEAAQSVAYYLYAEVLKSFSGDDVQRWAVERRNVEQLKNFYQALIKTDPPSRDLLVKTA